MSQMSQLATVVMIAAVQLLDPRQRYGAPPPAEAPISKETHVASAVHVAAHSCTVVLVRVQSSLRALQPLLTFGPLYPETTSACTLLACSSTSTRQRRRDQAEATVAGAMAATATALEPVVARRAAVATKIAKVAATRAAKQRAAAGSCRKAASGSVPQGRRPT